MTSFGNMQTHTKNWRNMISHQWNIVKRRVMCGGVHIIFTHVHHRIALYYSTLAFTHDREILRTSWNTSIYSCISYTIHYDEVLTAQAPTLWATVDIMCVAPLFYLFIRNVLFWVCTRISRVLDISSPFVPLSVTFLAFFNRNLIVLHHTERFDFNKKKKKTARGPRAHITYNIAKFVIYQFSILHVTLLSFRTAVFACHLVDACAVYATYDLWVHQLNQCIAYTLGTAWIIDISFLFVCKSNQSHWKRHTWFLCYKKLTIK